MSRRTAVAITPLREQARLAADWFDALPAEDFARPTVLDGWDVRTLLGHLVLVVQGCTRALNTPVDEPAAPAAEYVRRYRRDVDEIASATATRTADHSPAALLDGLRDAGDELPGDPPDRTVLGGRGPISALDWIVTRVVEIVVHLSLIHI